MIQYATLPNNLTTMYDLNKDENPLKCNSFISIINALCTKFSSISVFLDDLDECIDKQDIITLIRNLRNPTNHRMDDTNLLKAKIFVYVVRSCRQRSDPQCHATVYNSFGVILGSIQS
jgi:hypothetical protein